MLPVYTIVTFDDFIKQSNRVLSFMNSNSDIGS